jgi:hypothetical protein
MVYTAVDAVRRRCRTGRGAGGWRDARRYVTPRRSAEPCQSKAGSLRTNPTPSTGPCIDREIQTEEEP